VLRDHLFRRRRRSRASPDYIFNHRTTAGSAPPAAPASGAGAARAIEEGLPILRATTTGISAVIDAHGMRARACAAARAGAARRLCPAALPPTLFSRMGNALPLCWRRCCCSPPRLPCACLAARPVRSGKSTTCRAGRNATRLSPRWRTRKCRLPSHRRIRSKSTIAAIRGRRAARQPAGAEFPLYDNRQNYCCSSTPVRRMGDCRPRRQGTRADRAKQPAIRFFDAGVGDGTIAARVMRQMHRRFERHPSTSPARRSASRTSACSSTKCRPAVRTSETVLAITTSPTVTPLAAPRKRGGAAPAGVEGSCAHRHDHRGFEQQIQALQPFLANTGPPAERNDREHGAETPTVLVLYREDCRFLLDHVIPRQDRPCADFDLALAKPAVPLRAQVDFKAQKRARAACGSLRAGGRLLRIHSAGNDPESRSSDACGPERIRSSPPRHEIVEATRARWARKRGLYLRSASRRAGPCSATRCTRCPTSSTGKAPRSALSTLLAAWNGGLRRANGR